MSKPSKALVQVQDIAMDFDVSPPWLTRVIERKPRLKLHAVDGVSFEIEKLINVMTVVNPRNI